MIRMIKNKIVLAAALMTSAAITLAQPNMSEIPQPSLESNKGTQLPIILRCFNHPADNGLKNNFGELPFVEGEGNIEFTHGKDLVPINMKLFVNPNTQSWTIMFILSPKLNCVAAGGSGTFKPADIAEEGIRM